MASLFLGFTVLAGTHPYTGGHSATALPSMEHQEADQQDLQSHPRAPCGSVFLGRARDAAVCLRATRA